MKHAGLNMGQVKLNNRSSILKYINDVGPVSRKDIAIATGLTPAAVTQITTSLIAEGILKELGAVEETKSAGRKKILVDIDYHFVHVLTANIETKKTYLAIVDMKGRVLCRMNFDTDKTVSPQDFLHELAQNSRELLAQAKKSGIKVKGMCVTLPGQVDAENGISWHAYGIWEEEVPVCAILKKELKLDVVLENNVNAFAMAEMLYGVGRKYDNFMLVKWGPGVGCSIVVDNKIYEGRRNRAAELGHYIVDLKGKKCTCGKTGCLETLLSYQSLREVLDFEPENFSEALEAAPEETAKKIYSALETFAVTIVNTITILAPNRVVLCGHLFKDKKIRNLIMEKCYELEQELSSSRIMYTELSGEEEIIGPAAVFIQQNIYQGL